jgi:hypothetical protein
MTTFIIIARTAVSLTIQGGAKEMISFDKTKDNEWTAVPVASITDLLIDEVCRARGATSVTIVKGCALIITDPQDPPVPPFRNAANNAANRDLSFKALLDGKPKYTGA